MNRIFLIVIISVLYTALLGAQGAFRPMDDNEAFLHRMKEIASSTTSIECTFQQEKELSFMQRKMVSEGRLYFSGSDKLRWEYVKPYSYAILLVQDQLVIIDEGQVNETNLGKNPSFIKVQQLLTSSLKGDFAATEDLFGQEFFENDLYYRISLIPQQMDMKEYLTQMDIYFEKEKFMLARFVMNENGDKTTTTFSDQKINKKLPADIFQWN